jgi:hypothetical protein
MLHLIGSIGLVASRITTIHRPSDYLRSKEGERPSLGFRRFLHFCRGDREFYFSITRPVAPEVARLRRASLSRPRIDFTDDVSENNRGEDKLRHRALRWREKKRGRGGDLQKAAFNEERNDPSALAGLASADIRARYCFLERCIPRETLPLSYSGTRSTIARSITARRKSMRASVRRCITRVYKEIIK